MRWAYTEQMGLELETWEQPLLMVVLDQVSTRGASNTLRLACEDLEVPLAAGHCPVCTPPPHRAVSCAVLPLTAPCRTLTQERDLIALALRFAIARYCGEARHRA